LDPFPNQHFKKSGVMSVSGKGFFPTRRALPVRLKWQNDQLLTLGSLIVGQKSEEKMVASCSPFKNKARRKVFFCFFPTPLTNQLKHSDVMLHPRWS
jgi:hypothetical protein